jgi:hypothetical protein
MIYLLFFLSLFAADDSKFLKNCFQDYVVAFSVEPPADIFATQDVRKRCLSKDFVGTSSDVDDVLLVQDYQESWLTNITVKVTSKNSAEVILGSGDETHCLSVDYAKKKISSIKLCK